ncbi:MAG: response regulator [Bacteroidetes bacterium]|nr:response regulator [Bacteroidota bacterium]
METNNKKKIFLVDDDVDYILQMTKILENLGFEVVSACGQKEGEEMISKIKPDLAILDLMMENKDSGFILSHRIKNIHPNVPVIIASAMTSETGMIFSLEDESDRGWIKADLYLEKGLRTDQLHREINKLLKL